MAGRGKSFPEQQEREASPLESPVGREPQTSPAYTRQMGPWDPAMGVSFTWLKMLSVEERLS